jgi:hypothetical protein
MSPGLGVVAHYVHIVPLARSAGLSVPTKAFINK